MVANPFIEFPLKKEFEDVHRQFTRLLRLMNDWETLINGGMSEQEAEEIIRMLSDKYLNLDNYGQ